MLKDSLQRYFKSEFVKNVITIFAGASIAQVVPFIVAPILSRLYSPSDFAILGIFTITALFFGNIATLQYDRAIMLPKENGDAINLVALSLICVVCFTFLSAIVVVVFNAQLVSLMKNEAMQFWLYLVPISVFLQGLYRIISSWSSRIKQFNRIAVKSVIQSSTTAGFKVSFGFLKYNPGGLIIGSLFGQLVANSYLIYKASKDDIRLKQISKNNIVQIAIEYKHFPLITNWQSFIDSFNSTATQYIISNLFGVATLGYYSFTFGIIQRPMQLIGQAVSQVFYQRAADIKNKSSDLWLATKKVIIRLALLGLVLFLPILVFGPEIFVFIFGEEWATAGLYAQFLIPWLFAKFISTPITSIPIVIRKQKEFFIWGIVFNTIIPLIFFIVGKQIGNFNIALILNSIFVFVFTLFLLNWMRNEIKKIKDSQNNTNTKKDEF